MDVIKFRHGSGYSLSSCRNMGDGFFSGNNRCLALVLTVFIFTPGTSQSGKAKRSTSLRTRMRFVNNFTNVFVVQDVCLYSLKSAKVYSLNVQLLVALMLTMDLHGLKRAIKFFKRITVKSTS